MLEPGTKVRIQDYSEAQGCIGKVLWVQEDGIIVVQLEGEDTVWPLLDASELEILEEVSDA